jgi:hypothetical protein
VPLPEVVLLQKIYGEVSIEEFGNVLRKLCEGLRVELTELGLVEGRVAKVKVVGEDEKAALSLLEKEIGLAPVTMENVERFSTLRGNIVFSGRSKVELFVDVGLFLPKPIYATVSLQHLQGQLVDGKKFALERVTKLFGLADGYPLQVQVVNIEESNLRAEMTEGQLELYSSWIASRTDRLIVLGVLKKNLKTVVRKAGLLRDVLTIESLGMAEHVLVCKLGTDAAGLVPKIGRRLPKANLTCFSPRQILELVEGRWET